MTEAEESVVLVHGLWMNGMDMGLLGRRLRGAGFNTSTFRYHALKSTPEENANTLHGYLQAIDTPVVHYVCHSLGGLIVRHLLSRYPDCKPGRVVCLGTPHQASSAARCLSRTLPGRWLLGHSIEQGLMGDVPSWNRGRELGVIAGNLRMGMGLLLPGIPRPSDGTVSVQETMLEGMTDHVVLPVSHTGLLLSARVALQVVYFLQHGRFQHQDG